MAGRRNNGFVMFRNRFLRLLSTLIIGGVIAGICYLVVLTRGISGTYMGGALMEFALFPLGVCFVGQILGDILNDDGFLNNTHKVKLIIFLIVYGLCFFACYVSVKDAPISAFNVWGEAVFYAEILSMTLAFAGYIFWYPEYGQQKKRLVYYYIISVVGGYLLGIVCGFLTGIVANLEWFVFGISGLVFIAGAIYSFRAEEPPFDEYGDAPKLSAKDKAYLDSDKFKVSVEKDREWEEFQKRKRNPDGRHCIECKNFYFDDKMKSRCYLCGKIPSGNNACSKFDPNN